MTTPTTDKTSKRRILTGDTPTGRLHLGHYVGSLENRVRLQDEYDCYFLLANMHAFTTRADKAAEIRQDTIDIVMIERDACFLFKVALDLSCRECELRTYERE